MTYEPFAVEVANLGSTIPGVARVTIPNAIALHNHNVYTFEGKGGVKGLGVLGRSFGSKERGYSELVLLPYGYHWPGGTVLAELTVAPQIHVASENFVAHAWVADPARIWPEFTVRGAVVQWGSPTLHSTALQQVVTIHGAASNGFRASIEMRWGYDMPYIEFDARIVYSDLSAASQPSSPLTRDDVVVSFGGGRVRLWPESFSSHDYMGGGPAYAAQSIGLSGLVMGVPAHGDGVSEFPIDTGRIIARLYADYWQNHVLVHRRVVTDRVAPLPVEWALRMTRNNDATGDTGDRRAFGTLAGQEAFTCDLADLPKLLEAQMLEAARPTSHCEADGKPVSLVDHPDVRTYDGVPDPRAVGWGVPVPDLLSFRNGRALSRLGPQIESHIVLGYPAVATMLLNSPLTRWYLSDQTEMMLGALTWYDGQQRATGRMLKAFAIAHCLVDNPEDNARRERIEAWVKEKSQTITTNNAMRMAGGETWDVWPGYIDSDKLNGYPKNLGPSWNAAWSPFQLALQLDGFYHWQVLQPDALAPGAWNQQRRIARTIVAHGFYTRATLPQVFLPYYIVGWKPDGSAIENPVNHDSVVEATSTRLFRLTMAVAAVVVMRDEEAPEELRDRAQQIIRTEPLVDWDAARWLGVFLA